MKPSHPQTPEAVGRTAVERKVGHFMTPLLIWLDPSLRASLRYRPRTLSAIASQVDIAPTILSLNGVMPRISPFLGRDVSCLLEADCAGDNVAYLVRYRRLLALYAASNAVLERNIVWSWRELGASL